MKNLSLCFIALIIILAACSSSPTGVNNSFMAHRIGDFMLVSPTKAQLQYKNMPQQSVVNHPHALEGDTVFITNLNQKGLIVKKDTIHFENGDKIYSSVEFIDSTNFKAFDWSLTKMSVTETNGFKKDAMSYSRGPGYNIIAFGYNYTCGTSLPREYNAIISEFNRDSTFSIAYQMKFTGLNQVLETINHCN